MKPVMGVFHKVTVLFGNTIK